jgi:hypothetical protein
VQMADERVLFVVTALLLGTGLGFALSLPETRRRALVR